MIIELIDDRATPDRASELAKEALKEVLRLGSKRSLAAIDITNLQEMVISLCIRKYHIEETKKDREP